MNNTAFFWVFVPLTVTILFFVILGVSPSATRGVRLGASFFIVMLTVALGQLFVLHATPVPCGSLRPIHFIDRK